MSTGKLPIVFLSVLMISSITPIVAQDLDPLEEIKKIKVDLIVELTPEGRCEFECTGSATTEPSEEPIEILISKAVAEITVSSPSPSILRLNLSASADFTKEVPPEIAGLSKDGINALISLSGIVGKSLPEILGQMGEDISQIQYPDKLSQFLISKLECTKFSVSGRRVNASFVLELSGMLPENVREELPLTADLQLEISESLFELSMNVTSESGSLDFLLQGDPSAGKLEFRLLGVFDLPKENERVFWTLGAQPEYSIPLELVENILPLVEVSLILKVPEGASVEDIPPGYIIEDEQTFEWSGAEASNAILQILAGQSIARISYTPSQPLRPTPMTIAIAIVIIIGVVATVVVVFKR